MGTRKAGAQPFAVLERPERVYRGALSVAGSVGCVKSRLARVSVNSIQPIESSVPRMTGAGGRRAEAICSGRGERAPLLAWLAPQSRVIRKIFLRPGQPTVPIEGAQGAGTAPCREVGLECPEKRTIAGSPGTTRNSS